MIFERRSDELQRQLGRLQVTHLTDEHAIRILTQCRAHCGAERVRVSAELSLVDDRSPVLVQVLDRILDRDDVMRFLAVDEIDHRGERGALARTRRSGHQYQAARLLADIGYDRRQAELLEGRNPPRNQTQRAGNLAPLHEDVGTKAGHILEAEREVDLEVLFELRFLLLGHDRVQELLGFVLLERRILHRFERPIDAYLRRHAGRDVKI